MLWGERRFTGWCPGPGSAIVETGLVLLPGGQVREATIDNIVDRYAPTVQALPTP